MRTYESTILLISLKSVFQKDPHKRALMLNLREEYDGKDLLERRVPVGSK
jgi:hypothetical protein